MGFMNNLEGFSDSQLFLMLQLTGLDAQSKSQLDDSERKKFISDLFRGAKFANGVLTFSEREVLRKRIFKHCPEPYVVTNRLQPDIHEALEYIDETEQEIARDLLRKISEVNPLFKDAYEKRLSLEIEVKQKVLALLVEYMRNENWFFFPETWDGQIVSLQSIILGKKLQRQLPQIRRYVDSLFKNCPDDDLMYKDVWASAIRKRYGQLTLVHHSIREMDKKLLKSSCTPILSSLSSIEVPFVVEKCDNPVRLPWINLEQASKAGEVFRLRLDSLPDFVGVTSPAINLKDGDVSGDALTLRQYSNGVVLAAVADAAGHSDESFYAASKGVEALIKPISEGFMVRESSAEQLEKLILKGIVSMHQACRDIGGCCTLSMVMLIPLQEEDTYLSLFLKVGDACAFILSEQEVKELSPQSISKSMRFSGGALGELLIKDTLEKGIQFHAEIVRSGTQIVIGSDGLRDNLDPIVICTPGRWTENPDDHANEIKTTLNRLILQANSLGMAADNVVKYCKDLTDPKPDDLTFAIMKVPAKKNRCSL